MGKAKRAHLLLAAVRMVGTAQGRHSPTLRIQTPRSPETRHVSCQRRRKPLTFVFEDDGLVPNNPLPFLVYKAAVDVTNDHPEKTIEGLFGANGWGAMWRNGVYDYLHYHATVHEALGVARGSARVQFGGDRGKALEISAGDVAILPAGTGHQLHIGQRRFLRGRRLSAGSADADHAADAGKPREGAEDDSGSEAAEDRSGDG